MMIFIDVKDKEQNLSLKIWYLRHHLNKVTSQTNLRFGYEKLNRFKKISRDFKFSYNIKENLEVELTFQ